MKVLSEVLLYFIIMFMPCWIILASYGINCAIDAMKEKRLEEFNKCFEERMNEKISTKQLEEFTMSGMFEDYVIPKDTFKCYGLYGGDKSTDNISYSCLDCPHLSIITEDELWDMCGDRSKHDPAKIHYYIKKGGER